ERTSPYQFYQYWINTDDRDVERFLAFFTFSPMSDVRSLGRAEGAGLNEAERVLAFEATKLCHGEAAAAKAKADSESLFATGKNLSVGGASAEESLVPRTHINRAVLIQGISFGELRVLTKLADSKH